MQNPQRDPEVEKKLLFSILEYLQSLTREENNLGLDRESLQVAIDCLSSAVKLNISDPQQRQLYSVGNVSLPNIFSLGLARTEQLELALKHLRQQRESLNEQSTKSLPTNTTPSPPQPSVSATHDDPKFRAYLEFLKSRGYFDGVTEGSPEWQERYTLAKERYYTRHPPTSSSASSSLSSAASHVSTPTSSPSMNNTNVSAAAATRTPPLNSSTTTTSPSTSKPISEEQIQQAEKYKTEGNDKMQAKKYEEAIQCYTKAIELTPNNPIYYGNRAAAYSHLGQHQLAIDDCRRAISLDPKYVKAYSRLGLAYFSLGKYREAVESYRKALELDPTNAAIRDSLSAAEIKLREHVVSQPPSMSQTPPFNNRAGGVPPEMPSIQEMMNFINSPAFQQMFRGMAQGLMGQLRTQSVSGMPTSGNFDPFNNPQLASLFSNPEQLNAMTQQLLNNPAIVNMATQLMQNPAVINAMNNFLGGNFAPFEGNIPGPNTPLPPSQLNPNPTSSPNLNSNPTSNPNPNPTPNPNRSTSSETGTNTSHASKKDPCQ